MPAKQRSFVQADYAAGPQGDNTFPQAFGPRYSHKFAKLLELTHEHEKETPETTTLYSKVEQQNWRRCLNIVRRCQTKAVNTQNKHRVGTYKILFQIAQGPDRDTAVREVLQMLGSIEGAEELTPS